MVNFCRAHKQGTVQQLPNVGGRPLVTPRCFLAFVAENEGRFFVRQRPAGVINAHLWEFPNVEARNGDAQQAARKLFGNKRWILKRLCVFKHSITRYRITMEVFHLTGNTPRNRGPEQGAWLNTRQLSLLPFSSAHKKILMLALQDGAKLHE